MRIVAVILLGLTAACSDPETETKELGETIFRQEVIEQPETETQESGEATSTQELLDRVRSVRGDRDPTRTDSGSDAFARLELCELDDTMEARIREVVEQLEELQLRYTERHPEVIATRRLLDELVQTALTDCVEKLQ